MNTAAGSGIYRPLTQVLLTLDTRFSVVSILVVHNFVRASIEDSLDELKSVTAMKYFKVAAYNLHQDSEKVLSSHLGQVDFFAGQVLLKLFNPMGKGLSKSSSTGFAHTLKVLKNP